LAVKSILVFQDKGNQDLNLIDPPPEIEFIFCVGKQALLRKVRQKVSRGNLAAIWIMKPQEVFSTIKLIKYLQSKPQLSHVPIIISAENELADRHWLFELCQYQTEFPPPKEKTWEIFQRILSGSLDPWIIEKLGDFILGKHSDFKFQIGSIKEALKHPFLLLIHGETGTGKTILARAIHEISAKNQGPFIDINCSAIPDSLIESELFGFEKGSFSGADANKKGLFVQGHKGTIFLDEIGEMPLKLQAKLLKVLEDRTIRPIGSSKTKTIDCNFIFATNLNLKSAIRQNHFRKDLFHRIASIEIQIPPLRDRIFDLNTLIAYWWKNHGDRLSIKKINQDFIQTLESYNFPGNVRELNNILLKSSFKAKDSTLKKEDLPSYVKEQTFNLSPFDQFHIVETFSKNTPYKKARMQLEKQLVESYIQMAEGNISKAARLAGLERRSFYKVMERLQKISPENDDQ